MKILVSITIAMVLLLLNFSKADAAVSITHSPINEDDKTLAWLKIEGLERGEEYEIRKVGEPWHGGDGNLSHFVVVDGIRTRTNTFVADSNGEIIIYNMCGNGEGDRDNCDERFGESALWHIEIYRVDTGDFVGSGNIAVATSSWEPPQQPCPNPTECPTAVGDLKTDPAGFVTQILQIAIGVSGGVAFILMVVGGIRMLVSAGDPEALAVGRDILTSAVVGLLFIIFSVVLLRIIGLDVLKIPGFGG